MRQKSYDVIIIGARAAGASLGILLGRQGKRVLMIDKATFPSDTLSTHHMSHVRYLDKLGVLEDVEARGYRKITRMRTYVGNSFIEGPRTDYTIIPKRDYLDHVLIKHATGYDNVHLLEGTIVQGLKWENDRVTGVKTNAPGFEEVSGELIVGADGMRSKVATWVNAETYLSEKAVRPVFYGYYQGIDPLEETATEIFLQNGRIGFLFPMEPGRYCLGLEIHQDEFKRFAADPEREFESHYQQLYRMDKRLRNSELEGRIVGSPGVENFIRKPYGKGWALIGDAAHSKDPSTGLGINDAFMQAFLLSDAIEARDEGTKWSDAMEVFHQKRDEAILPAYELTVDYIRGLRAWTEEEHAYFDAMAANPIVWSKLVSHLPQVLREKAKGSPILWESVRMESNSFLKGGQ
ncbi:NAD(P)/FAD-dependent oxidoreductase [Thalassobacillus hwangdonensis]|uniref:NAD(P)/FAD-dependent oxidoreductase n=1 Tax=Thalassobacillus hwangdonensis TaxID=546108 RepID=A0ABW3L1K7_9BACI